MTLAVRSRVHHGAEVRSVPPTPELDAGDIARALQQFEAFIRAQGLKRSTARESVARASLRRVGHFTADDVLEDLRDMGAGNVHPATVYRVLPLLVEAGLLQHTLFSTGDRTFFERAFEREHHDHLICTSCGKVVEFHFEAFEMLQDDLAQRFGFELTAHVHELRGICPDCIAKRNKG